MATQERIAQLESLVQIWRDAIGRAQEQFNDLLRAKELGFTLTDHEGKDILPDRIAQEDFAVRAYNAALTRTEFQLSQAKIGKDV